MIFFFVAIMALALIQPSGNSRTACCIFAATITAFDLLCGNLSGEFYFLAGAIDSAICFILIRELKPMTHIPYILQLFCAASIILNLIGYRMFENEMSGTLYVTSFQVFHLLAIVILIYWGPYDYFKRAWNSRIFLLFDSMGNNFYLETEN